MGDSGVVVFTGRVGADANGPRWSGAGAGVPVILRNAIAMTMMPTLAGTANATHTPIHKPRAGRCRCAEREPLDPECI